MTDLKVLLKERVNHVFIIWTLYVAPSSNQIVYIWNWTWHCLKRPLRTNPRKSLMLTSYLWLKRGQTIKNSRFLTWKISMPLSLLQKSKSWMPSSRRPSRSTKKTFLNGKGSIKSLTTTSRRREEKNLNQEQRTLTMKTLRHKRQKVKRRAKSKMKRKRNQGKRRKTESQRKLVNKKSPKTLINLKKRRKKAKARPRKLNDDYDQLSFHILTKKFI